jgi:crotonobetainyl-CoA:carnitine CoA-transferase CaiB-like acyl-CoA transferase
MAGQGALAPYRILDLTTERGWLAGKLLADLGAEVVKIEPPGGDPGRLKPPFARGLQDAEHGLGWLAFNRGKRSAVLDLEQPAGRARFLELAAEADAVLDSFDPGRLEALGLDLAALHAVNPRLVLTRVTPFGQTGPYAHFAASDLILSAIGGASWLAGEPDRAPVRITAPQYFQHGAAEAALHTIIAMGHAAAGGPGQQLDVSAQAATVRTLMTGFTHAYTDGKLLRRERFGKPDDPLPGRQLFRCADGYVIAFFTFGPGLAGYRSWAEEEGETIPEALASVAADELALGMAVYQAKPPEFAATLTEFFAAFIAKRTRRALVAGAMQRRLLICNVNTLADVLEDDQLEARGYFQPVVHADGTTARYPGAWAKLTATPLAGTPHAPGVGEHDAAVWREDGAARAPRTTPATAASGADVFADLKVWDTSWAGVGPLTARYFADYGAQVVRSESTRSIDVLRRVEPFKDGVRGLNRSQFFAEYNPSKLGLGLNFATPEGKAVALRLAAWADVVVESFSPGVMAGLGLAYEDLAKVNPSLIMVSTSMNGQTGPRRRFAGFGNLLAGMAGLVDLTGWPDRTPSSPFGAYTDFIAQRFCGMALAAALDHRRRTGEGQHIDLSQYEASLQFLAPLLLDAEINGRVLSRQGNRSPHTAPHGAFRCLDEDGIDRWVAIAVETEDHWRALLRLAEDAPGLSDPRFATLAGRKTYEDALEAVIGAWTAGQTAWAVTRRLQPKVPAAPVQTNHDLLNDAQLQSRGYLVPLRHAEVGEIFYEGSQVIASVTQPYPRKAAPAFGADSRAVLQDWLGYAPTEVDALIACGAVEPEGPPE